jgi:hypothetical protein
MSDVKPRRPVRASARSEISPGEAVPPEAAPAIVPEAPSVAEAVAAPAAEIAEPAPEILSAAAEPQTDSVDKPALETVPPIAEPQADAVDDPWTAFAEAQAALARGFEEIAVEVTGITRSGALAAADAAVALLGARTFSEAVEINAALARRGVDAMIEGSAKLSEIGVKVVSEASRPILSRLDGPWGGLAAGG